MVLTDDIGWGTLGAYGGGKVVGAPTPNLDEMARDGMKFLSAYSEPSCTPTRLALLTGRQPHRTGVNVVLWPGQKQGLVDEEVTIAELLKDGGYDTAMWGKWHVGDVYDEHLPQNRIRASTTPNTRHTTARSGVFRILPISRESTVAQQANRLFGWTCRKITSSVLALKSPMSMKGAQEKNLRK
jgi:arylsulfatase A-like enzyme